MATKFNARKLVDEYIGERTKTKKKVLKKGGRTLESLFSGITAGERFNAGWLGQKRQEAKTKPSVKRGGLLTTLGGAAVVGGRILTPTKAAASAGLKAAREGTYDSERLFRDIYRDRYGKNPSPAVALAGTLTLAIAIDPLSYVPFGVTKGVVKKGAEALRKIPILKTRAGVYAARRGRRLTAQQLTDMHAELNKTLRDPAVRKQVQTIVRVVDDVQEQVIQASHKTKRTELVQVGRKLKSVKNQLGKVQDAQKALTKKAQTAEQLGTPAARKARREASEAARRAAARKTLAPKLEAKARRTELVAETADQKAARVAEESHAKAAVKTQEAAKLTKTKTYLEAHLKEATGSPLAPTTQGLKVAAAKHAPKAIAEAGAVAGVKQEQALKMLEFTSALTPVQQDAVKAAIQATWETGKRVGEKYLDKGIFKGPLRKYYLWRGWEMFSHPEEVIERLRVGNPELAANLERKVLGGRRGAGASIGQRITKRRGVVGQETQALLGQLPIEERISAQGAIAGRELGVAGELEELAQYAIDAPKEGYIQIGEEMTKQTGRHWGALQGKYVPKWLAAHLNVISSTEAGPLVVMAKLALPSAEGELTRIPGYSRTLGAFKTSHVVANPPTVARNLRTNALSLYLRTDLPIWRVPGAIWDGVKLTAAKGGKLAEKRQGWRDLRVGFGGTEVDEELRQLLEHSPSKTAFVRAFWNTKFAKNVVHPVYRGVLGSFEKAEQIFKYGGAEALERMGVEKAEAAGQSIGALFDYGEVSRFTNVLRRSGVYPFATYPIKALQSHAIGVLERPGKYARLGHTLNAVEAAARAKDPNVESERVFDPPWLTGGKGLLLPGLDERGNPYRANTSYELPFGFVGEPWAGFGLSQAAPLLQAPAAIARNEHPFTKRPIWNEQTDTPAEKAAKIAKFAASYLTPPIGISGAPRIIRQAQGKPDVRGTSRPEEMSWARRLLGEGLGLRSYSVHPGKARGDRAAEDRRRKADAKREVKPQLMWGTEEEKIAARGRRRAAVVGAGERIQERGARSAEAGREWGVPPLAQAMKGGALTTGAGDFEAKVNAEVDRLNREEQLSSGKGVAKTDMWNVRDDFEAKVDAEVERLNQAEQTSVGATP